MNNDFKSMLEQFESVKASILNSGKDTASPEVLSESAKVQWAYNEGYRPAYDPNADKVTWEQRKPTPMEKVPTYMRTQGSMSPEQLANAYTIFQAKNTAPLDILNGSTVAEVQRGIVTDMLAGNISEQRAEEMLKQLAKSTLPIMKEITGWSESKLKAHDKVSTKEARDALIALKGGDVATESDYLKSLKEGE